MEGNTNEHMNEGTDKTERRKLYNPQHKCRRYKYWTLNYLLSTSEDSDQTGQIPCSEQSSLCTHVILLVLSCGGSNNHYIERFFPTKILNATSRKCHNLKARPTHDTKGKRNKKWHTKTNKCTRSIQTSSLLPKQVIIMLNRTENKEQS